MEKLKTNLEGVEALSLVKLLPKCHFLSWISIPLILSASLLCNAQTTATEVVRTENLQFRGQGRASLCYAFAEEQMLKDAMCSGDCSGNADQWKLSIFDIAKAHKEKAVKDHPGLITGDVMVDLTSNGSSHFFPYSELNIQSVRASECTLEKELFYLNRSKVTNPDRLQFHDYVMGLYDRFMEKSLSSSDLEPAISSAGKTLEELALSSSSRFEFLAKAIDYSSCSKRVSLPKVTVKKEDVSDESKIEKLILPLLRAGQSLYVGVCAEVIKSESKDETPCGRHAVVLKGLEDNSCSGSSCKVGVIDSAFFSLRPMNNDGSSWLPLDIVVQAISKSSLDFRRIMSKAKADNKAIIDGFRETAKQSTKDFIQSMKDSLKATPNNLLKDTLISQMESAAEVPSEESNEISRALMATVLQEVKKLNISSLSDLDLLEPPVEKLFVTFYHDFFVEKQSKLKDLQANGIVWVEREGE